MGEKEFRANLTKVCTALSAKLPGTYLYGSDALDDEELILPESFLPLFVLSANQFSVIVQGKRILPFIIVKDDDGLCGLNIQYDDSEADDEQSGGAGFIGLEEIPTSSIWAVATHYLAASMRQILVNDLTDEQSVDVTAIANSIVDMVEPIPNGSRIPEQNSISVAMGLIKECLQGFEKAQAYQGAKQKRNMQGK